MQSAVRMLHVNKKVVVVFGGNGGIGKCTVLELLNNDVKGVVIADLSGDHQSLLAFYGNDKKDKVAFISTDVTKLESIKAAFDLAAEKFQSVDIVINCAGVVNEQNYAECVTINLIGAMHIVHEAYNYLPKHKSSKSDQGVIVNLASTAGLAPLVNFPIYSASKAGMVAFSYSMGKKKEMEDDLSVKIITVCPSATETPMLNTGKKLCKTTTGKVQKNLIEIFESMPAQKPESVAKCILHVIQYGENASCWVSKDNEEAKLADYDAILDMAKSL